MRLEIDRNNIEIGFVFEKYSATSILDLRVSNRTTVVEVFMIFPHVFENIDIYTKTNFIISSSVYKKSY